MKTMTLEEAFRKGIVKKGDYIDYRLTVATCTLDPTQTGWKGKQTFLTEQLGWQLDEFEGKPILLADKVTEQELGLAGEIGYTYGVEAQHQMCRKLYMNASLASDVISITLDIQKATSLVLKNIRYWLASSYANVDGGYASFGVRLVFSGRVYDSGLWSSSYGSRSDYFGVRPVVYLKSGIQIVNLEQGDGSKEHPWKIVANDVSGKDEEAKNTLENSQVKSELMQMIEEGEKLIRRAKELLKRM